MSGYLGEGYGMHRDHDPSEGRDPRAREAAEQWQQRFGREGHEGSYARHFQDPSYRSYRSYRERHLAELDQDYDEWCRSQEQAFHRDFDEFRGRRQQGSDRSGLEPGALMTNEPGDSSTLAEDREADALVAVSEDPVSSRPRRRGR